MHLAGGVMSLGRRFRTQCEKVLRGTLPPCCAQEDRRQVLAAVGRGFRA